MRISEGDVTGLWKALGTFRLRFQLRRRSCVFMTCPLPPIVKTIIYSPGTMGLAHMGDDLRGR